MDPVSLLILEDHVLELHVTVKIVIKLLNVMVAHLQLLKLQVKLFFSEKDYFSLWTC